LAPFSVIGKRLPRIDAVDKATGKVTFGVDVRLPGMLHGKLLRSPYPHALILHIDKAKAAAIPGVKAVITGRDIPDNLVGYAIKDEYCLAKNEVRCIGDPVAAVAAVDEDTAERAVAAIEVEYRELPAVFDAEEAMTVGAPLVHTDLGSYRTTSLMGRRFNPQPGTNICNRQQRRRGDVERGFQESDLVFEDTFRTHMVHHGYIEPQAALAYVDPAGKITVWCNTQRPYGVRDYLATALGLPMSRIRVVGTKVGAGFGGKIAPRVTPGCVLLALKTGQPVKMVLTRDEELTATAGRVPAVVTVKTGVKRDGRIIARKIDIVFDTGAYAEGIPPSNRAINDAAGPYKAEHLEISSTLVYTNKMRGTPFRGLGVPQAAWGVEVQMDMIAEKLGMDPVELRLSNLVEDGDIDSTGAPLHSVGVKECLRQTAQAIGWGQPKAGPSRGRGVAVLHKSPTTLLSASSAVVKVNEDGTIVVLTGASDIGQGSDTALSMIAAEVLGLSLADVSIVSADTDTTPFDHGTFSSRLTLYAGNAVRRAALEVRRQILELASQQLEAPVEALEMRDKRVFVRDHPHAGVSLGEAALTAIAVKGAPIMGQGSSYGPGTGQVNGAVPGWKYGAHAAEVEVDPETGQVTVLKFVATHDYGQTINPTMAEGQIEGGVGMGISCTLSEEVLFDDGRVTNPSFMDYRMLTSADTPPIESRIVEVPLPEGPFGAKGGGEPSFIAVAPAIANAIYDAVGVRILDLPITPEKVLRALEKKKRQT